MSQITKIIISILFFSADVSVLYHTGETVDQKVSLTLISILIEPLDPLPKGLKRRSVRHVKAEHSGGNIAKIVLQQEGETLLAGSIPV